MNKIEDKVDNLIEEMTLENFKGSSERTQPKRVGDKLELDVIFILSSKVNAMSQKLEPFSDNSVSSSTPFASCDINKCFYMLQF